MYYGVDDNLAYEWCLEHIGKAYPQVFETHQNDIELWEKIFHALDELTWKQEVEDVLHGFGLFDDPVY